MLPPCGIVCPLPIVWVMYFRDSSTIAAALVIDTTILIDGVAMLDFLLPPAAAHDLLNLLATFSHFVKKTVHMVLWCAAGLCFVQ